MAVRTTPGGTEISTNSRVDSGSRSRRTNIHPPAINIAQARVPATKPRCQGERMINTAQTGQSIGMGSTGQPRMNVGNKNQFL